LNIFHWLTDRDVANLVRALVDISPHINSVISVNLLNSEISPNLSLLLNRAIAICCEHGGALCSASSLTVHIPEIDVGIFWVD